MEIIEEVKYHFKKVRDYVLFRTFWMGKQKCKIKPVSKTILVIRIDAIGDCIIWLDQAKVYRKTYPSHRLVLLHNKVWADIAERLPWFDRSKICERKYYKEILSTLNKYTYEKVYSPVFSRDFFTVDWIVHNVHAIEKIGYEGDYQNNHALAVLNLYCRNNTNSLELKRIADKWYSTLILNDDRCVMELQRNTYFVQKTLDDKFRSQLPSIPFTIPRLDNLIKQKYTILFLGASTPSRIWPVEYFVRVTDSIPQQVIYLCGSETDKTYGLKFIDLYNGGKTIINMIGKTTLLDLISIISNAELIITNETSACHIAVATRTQSICLLGGGHYGRFQPYIVDYIPEQDVSILPIIVTADDHSCFSCDWHCKYHIQNDCWKCIDNIQVEDVISAIKQIWNPLSQ